MRSLIRKLKAIWKWSTGYTVVFVSVDKTYTVKHRIGRAPEMISEATPKAMARGMKMSGIMIDETINMTKEEMDEFWRN